MATSSVNQTLACSRRPIPRDEETRKKAMKVIDAQFDLEILLRHRELQKVKEELKKSELYLNTLKHCILEPPSNSHRTSTHNSNTCNENLGAASVTPTRHSTRKIYSTRDNDYFYYDPCKDLYSRRNDGTFVRLACPKCHRSKFINVQGFLNHCRLSHRIEFPNHEEALLKCGTPVDESLIPPGHPARSRVITRPPSLRTILGQSNLFASRASESRPTIKVFEEEIDLGLDELSSRAEINNSSQISLAQNSPNNNNETMSYSENSPFLSCTMSDRITNTSENRATLGSLNVTDSDYSSDVDEGDTGTTTTDIDFSPLHKSTPPDYPNTMICDNQSTMKSSEEPETKGLARESITDVDSTSPMDIDPSININTDDQQVIQQKGKSETTKINININDPTIQLDNKDNKDNRDNIDTAPNYEMVTSDVSVPIRTSNTTVQEVTTISATYTIPACTSVFDPIDHGSRFYVKRRIVIGNVSKWITPEKRDSSLRKYTHKWMIYVTGPPHDLNITPFIQRVRFFLHPSYRPLDVVDVTEPPFQLTRFGWGEFPIRIQLIFVDKKNKPVDLIHVLKLDNIHNGKQQLGNERAFDLELDRNTQFIDPKQEGPINHTVNVVQDVSQQGISDANNILNEIDAKELLQKEKNNDKLDTETMSVLEPLLNEAIKNYPLIIPLSARTSTLPYATAKSTRVFLNWNIERRKVIEWQRARLVRLLVLSLSRTLDDSRVQSIAASLTTKQVIVWCRDKGHTPVDNDSTHTNVTIDNNKSTGELKQRNLSSITGYQVTWCKCCGCPESWHEINTSTSKSIGVPITPYKCKRRPHFLETKKTKLCSLTLAQDFLEELYHDKDLKGDESINKYDEDCNLNINGISIQNKLLSVESVKNTSELKGWYKLNSTLNPQGIDWIWEVVDQLKLNGVVATKLVKFDGKIDVENGDTNAAIQQRLETGNLIFQLTKIFMKDLVDKAINIYKSEQLDDPFVPEVNWFSSSVLDSRYNSYRQRLKKILVPYHLYQAIQGNLNTFDFLNGEGLASDKKKIQE